MSIIKTHRFTDQDRKVMAEYLQGEATQLDTAEYFSVKRQTVYSMTDVLFRHLVQAGKIDIIKLLKDY